MHTRIPQPLAALDRITASGPFKALARHAEWHASRAMKLMADIEEADENAAVWRRELDAFLHRAAAK